MRACMNGRESTTLFLYRWDPLAFRIRNYDGESCLDLAAPFDSLYNELERLERSKSKSAARNGNSSSIEQQQLRPEQQQQQFLKPLVSPAAPAVRGLITK